MTAEEDSAKLDGMSLGPVIPHKTDIPDPDRWEKVVAMPDLTEEQWQWGDLLEILTAYQQIYKVARFQDRYGASKTNLCQQCLSTFGRR